MPMPLLPVGLCANSLLSLCLNPCPVHAKPCDAEYKAEPVALNLKLKAIQSGPNQAEEERERALLEVEEARRKADRCECARGG